MTRTKEELAEYSKKYRKLNKEKIEKYLKVYRENNREKAKETSKEYTKNNKAKISIKKKEYHKENKKSAKEYDLKKNFGITLDDYNLMYENQKGLCAICNKPETVKQNFSEAMKMLAVDHCHKTGKIRALLCSKHNMALGLFMDDIDLLESALNYLKKHNA